MCFIVKVVVLHLQIRFKFSSRMGQLFQARLRLFETYD